MSGPKTSQLAIERMIAAQLAALREDVDDATVRARRAIAALRDELLAACAGDSELADAADRVRKAAERALERLTAECAFAPAPAMADSVERAERCQVSAVAIAEAFRTEMTGAEEHIDRTRAQKAAAKDATDFMALLARALGENIGGASRDAEATTAKTSRDADDSVGATSWSPSSAEEPSALRDGRHEAATQGDREVAPTRGNATDRDDAEAARSLQDVARRALALVYSPHTLAADRAVLAAWTPSLNDATAAQLDLLLPAMEANEAAMAELMAAIEMTETAAEAAARPAFATLEEAAAHLEALRARQAADDRNAYLQACIDEVMARHGYDIARSVSMGRDLTGAHRLFASEGADAGIHAFLSEGGDLMLQIAGLPDGIEGVAESAAVCLEGADGNTRADELLEAQRDFCAVYDEIADDLTAYGITNRVRYRAEADTAFSRELRAAAAGAKGAGAAEDAKGTTEDAGTARATGTAPYTTPRKRKRAGGAAREMR